MDIKIYRAEWKEFEWRSVFVWCIEETFQLTHFNQRSMKIKKKVKQRSSF